MGMVNVDTGAAIKAAMALKRISQSDLAVEMGVNQPRVSQLCAAKNCTVDSLCRVAGAVGMRPSELLALGEANKQ